MTKEEEKVEENQEEEKVEETPKGAKGKPVSENEIHRTDAEAQIKIDRAAEKFLEESGVTDMMMVYQYRLPGIYDEKKFIYGYADFFGIWSHVRQGPTVIRQFISMFEEGKEFLMNGLKGLGKQPYSQGMVGAIAQAMGVPPGSIVVGMPVGGEGAEPEPEDEKTDGKGKKGKDKDTNLYG